MSIDDTKRGPWQVMASLLKNKFSGIVATVHVAE